LSSDHLLSGVNAEYKKSRLGVNCTDVVHGCGVPKQAIVPSSQFSVKNAGVTEN
jgi:hypothetical protein